MTTTRSADDLDDYVRRIIDAAPPLTPSQRDRLALLLMTPERASAARQHETEAVRQRNAAAAEERRIRDERLAAIRRAERALWACGVCGVPQAGHPAASVAQHAWEPRSDL